MRVEALSAQVVIKVFPIHQLLTRTSWGLHQSCVVGFTRRAVTLKESRGQHPINNPLTHFKPMTTANLLNRATTAQIQTQDLTDDQLEMVSGGANETCRWVGDPRTGVGKLVCEQYKN